MFLAMDLKRPDRSCTIGTTNMKMESSKVETMGMKAMLVKAEGPTSLEL